MFNAHVFERIDKRTLQRRIPCGRHIRKTDMAAFVHEVAQDLIPAYRLDAFDIGKPNRTSVSAGCLAAHINWNPEFAAQRRSGNGQTFKKVG